MCSGGQRTLKSHGCHSVSRPARRADRSTAAPTAPLTATHRGTPRCPPAGHRPGPPSRLLTSPQPAGIGGRPLCLAPSTPAKPPDEFRCYFESSEDIPATRQEHRILGTANATRKDSVLPTADDLQTDLQERRQRVDTDFFDLSLRELVRMVEDDELQARPEYQRKFRWKDSTQRELIESLLMGLPIPAVFVATNSNGSWDVVDGLQRISTIVRFMGSEVARDKLGMGEPLELRDLPQLRRFDGVTFDDLPRQIRFLLEKRYIRVQVLSDQSVFDVRFELFRRLNSGAIALSAQEVRTVLYRGPFNRMLEELAEDPTYKSLVKLKRPDQENGTHAELVLKFFAYLDWQGRFTGAVTTFLNDYMCSRMDDTAIDVDKALFHRVCSRLAHVLDGPVKRPGVAWTPQNQLEAVMVAAGRILRANAHAQLHPRPRWLEDRDLVDASTKGTNTPKALAARIERAVELLEGAQPQLKP